MLFGSVSLLRCLSRLAIGSFYFPVVGPYLFYFVEPITGVFLHRRYSDDEETGMRTRWRRSMVELSVSETFTNDRSMYTTYTWRGYIPVFGGPVSTRLSNDATVRFRFSDRHGYRRTSMSDQGTRRAVPWSITALPISSVAVVSPIELLVFLSFLEISTWPPICSSGSHLVHHPFRHRRFS